MKVIWALLAFAVFCCCNVEAKYSPPKVQVYSHKPGQYGEQNTLLCYVSDFHPPDIAIKLEKNGEELPGAVQTDLSFKKGWDFHLTRHVAFTPQKGEHYTCTVTHGEHVNSYAWEPNM